MIKIALLFHMKFNKFNELLFNNLIKVLLVQQNKLWIIKNKVYDFHTYHILQVHTNSNLII